MDGLIQQNSLLISLLYRLYATTRKSSGEMMRRLINAEIAKNPQYADFSLDQSQLGVEDFYDRMDDVMSPSPLDPARAMKEAITSLEEQVKVRVTSVENGRKFQNSKRGEVNLSVLDHQHEAAQTVPRSDKGHSSTWRPSSSAPARPARV